MQKYLALINKNIVHSVVIGDEKFLEHVSNEYDFVVDVTDIKRPTAGDSYYPEANQFVNNELEIISIPANLDEEHMKRGTENGFEPFNISKYSVRYENGMVQIGCKKYSAAGLFDVAHKILIEKTKTIHYFDTSNGPTHGKFAVTWDDVKKLYDALSRVRF